MKQKLFTLLLAVAASVGTMFASNTKVDGIWYNFNSTNKTAEVTYRGSSSSAYSNEYAGVVTIPASVTYSGTTYSVTSIGENAFRDCSGLNSVTIPNSVTSIGNNAFAGCRSLTSVTIPNSITSIGWYAFSGCSGLTSVTIGDSVTIGECAFSGCSGLTSVTIPNSVNNIGYDAFNNCYNLSSIDFRGTIEEWCNKSWFPGEIFSSMIRYQLLLNGVLQENITIPNSVTSIGYEAFWGCSSLTSVTIPNSVTSIGDGAFYGCSSLTSVTIPNSVTSIGDGALSDCSSLTSVTIPNSVTSIGDYAFNGCSSLTSVTIPNSVTSIGDGAFEGCSSLTSVTIPNSVTSIGYYAFRGVFHIAYNGSATGSPWGATYINKYVEGWLIYEDSTKTAILKCINTISGHVDIPNTVTRIAGGAFEGCNGLTSVTIPNSVTSIGGGAFFGCSGIESIIWNAKECSDFAINNSPFHSNVTVFPEGESYYIELVPEISPAAFIFGNEVEHIPANICYGMNKLTSITIPNSVTSIGNDAFKGCSSITSVVWNTKNCNGWNFGSQVTSFIFGNEVEVIPAGICSGMNKLTSIEIPANVTSIGENAFIDCSNLKQVTINSNAVAGKAYSSSENLTTIFGTQVEKYIIGESVTAIGNYAMHNSSSLQNITLPSSVLSIGQSAFDGCSQLETVNLNSNAIVSKAYTATNNFAKIFGSQVLTYNLGDAITSIGDYAFYNCSNATSLNIPDGVTTIGNNSFADCSGVTSLVIPESVTSIGDNAFRECTGVETLTLPNVTTIGNSAFADCSNLTSLQLGNKLTTIGDSTFSSCYNLQAIAFPSTLKTIGNYAFYQCNHFTAIDIPASITFLGDGAFKGCTKLTTVSINSNAVMSKTYSSTSNLSTIFGSQVQSFTLGDAVTAIGDYAFYNCTSLPTITIPSNVTKIGGSAFYGCTGLKSMIIPEDITSIESNSFHGCTALSSVNLPNTITSIKDSAFFNCSSLQLESLPSAVSTLGKGAFSGCGSLASIAMPASLTSVGENAFNDCSGIAEVKIENVDSWCKIVFGNSKSNPVFYSRNLYIGDSLIAELTIPNKITELKPWTFVNCNSINLVFIPNTVRLFSPNAFNNCENIASVEWHAKNIADYASSAASPFYASRGKISSFVLGEEVEHVPAYLCNGMSKIGSLALPSYLKSIGDYSFKDLTKIRKINIPNEVTSIGAHAFDSCILVTSIYLGYQVEEIGDYAFKGCIRVNDITSMNTTTPVVYDNTLTSISQYAYLYIPVGSKRAYQLDPYWSRFDIHELASEEASLARDAVTVEANADNALFTWPVCDTAAYYSLQITKDEVVFCTLVFNSNGQLTGIAFAPGRNGNAHAPAAAMSIAGMSFTVTGLNAASKYAYRLAVSDEDKVELVTYSGEFATTGYTGEVNPGGEPIATAVDDITTNAQPTTKFFRDGQLFILRDGKTYTLQGVEVR